MKFKEEYHENLNVFHVGCEKTHNYFIPFAKGENPFADREKSSRFLLLNGNWEFAWFPCFYEAKHALEEGITFTEHIPVPSNWQLQGYGSPVYTNDRYEIPYDPPYVPDENATGVYHRKFRTEKKAGCRYYLTFEGVDSCFYLFVNGEFTGYSQVTHCTSEFDITDSLVSGENDIVAVVLRWCDGTYLEDQDKWRMSGIIRDIYLLTRQEKHLRSYRIITEIEEENDGRTLGIIRVDFGQCDWSPEVRLYDDKGQELGAARTADKAAVFRVENPVLWNAETPYLYSLAIEDGDEVIGEKVGIREVGVREGVFLVNGTPVKLKGVNRHDSYPDTGAAASKEQMRNDLLLMKRHNMNAIRCSHYPNAPFFLQMCDELGFYVIDEADLEAHGSYHIAETDEKGGIAYIVNQPLFAGAIMDRVERMVLRDRNRPSVIFWSLGNESGYSRYMEAAAQYMKETDPTRLVHYESTAQLANGNCGVTDESRLDVVSKMYASIPWIEEFLRDKTERRPFLQCEYCHAMGNGPGDLEDYWKLFYAQERIAGGFIWEWADHGLEIGHTVNGRKAYGYGGDFKEDMHDSNFCLDGLTFPDRKPHTGLLEAKQVYRPIRVKEIDKAEGIYEFVNTCSFTAMEDQWSCIMEIREKGDVVCLREIELMLPPLGHRQIRIPEAGKTCGDSTSLRFIFRLKHDTLWGKAGEQAGFEQFMLSEKPWLQWKGNESLIEADSKMKPGTGLLVEEDYKSYTVKGNGFCYQISKLSGLPDQMIYHDRVVTDKPVRYQVFRAPIDNDRNIKKEWERFRLKDFLQKVHHCTMKQCPDFVEVTAESGLGYKTYHNAMKVLHTLTIWGDGRIEINGQCKVRENRAFLPRFGIRIFLPSSYQKVCYYGYGPMESYVDKHQAAYKGMFESQVADMHEDYIKPQENGSHFGCDTVAISDDTLTIRTVSPKTFSFNVSEYTAEELGRAQHNYELNKSGYTVLSLDYKMSGVGSNSCGPELAEEYQLKEKDFSFSFVLMVCE